MVEKSMRQKIEVVQNAKGCIILKEIVTSTKLSAKQTGRLQQIAYADGHNLKSWLRDDDNFRSIHHYLSRTPLVVALSMLWDATRGDFYPWGMDVYPHVQNETEFRAGIKEWAQPSVEHGVTDQHVVWMLQMGEAALAHDGKTLRKLGNRLWKAWYA
jgi:hypothetical protein